ncbi:hypothetical protein DBR47_06755 [Paucibacter sp. KBW04]|uniref:hypothetical protein n=1 Tax=Paucibacter sp. KBW04 TaxID=2153361 RepID=UPI000F55DBD6|nr:hypothetical protein [Paucibacter sp. KBW04]RQO61823.1 hypothetical protein DBR47_06755 [Paucibacter sp. KBW04]
MSNADLAELFSQLTDEELTERVSSGGLTQDAQALAAAELRRRGAPLPPITSQIEQQEEAYLGDMVMLERGLTPTEAHMLSSCLRSAGIHADAGDTNIVQAHSLLTLAVGGASVRVPSTQLAEAKDLVAAFHRGDFALGEDFNPEETRP